MAWHWIEKLTFIGVVACLTAMGVITAVTLLYSLRWLL